MDQDTSPRPIPKQALLITVLSLGLGIVFDTLFYQKLPGLSFPIFTALVLLSLLIVASRSAIRLPTSSVFLMPPILFFATMVSVRAGSLITFLNVAMALFLGGLFLRSVFKPGLKRYVFSEYVEVFLILPIEILARAQKVIAETVTVRGAFKNHRSVVPFIRGVLITLPILLLFVLLFASADLVFRHYTADLFNFRLGDNLFWRTSLVLVVSALFTGILGYISQRPDSTSSLVQSGNESITTPPIPKLGLVETTMLFGSLNLLFFGFIAVQLRYLFGGQQNITRFGFTYAEYARKGFFELIAVAVLSFVLVFVAEKLLLRKGHRHTARFRFLASALIVQVMIIMASAFSRLVLYENAYGFTSLRLYAHICIVWLAAIFCILLYKIFRNKQEITFTFLMFLSVAGLVVTLNVINVDAFVAKKNIARYESTGKLDKEYLAQLSDDGVAETASLLDAKDPKIRNYFAGRLYERYHDLQQKERHWQSKNLSRQAAVDKLRPKESLLERYKPKPPQPPVATSKPEIRTTNPSTSTCVIPNVSSTDCAAATSILESALGRLDPIREVALHPGERDSVFVDAPSTRDGSTALGPVSISWQPAYAPITIDPPHEAYQTEVTSSRLAAFIASPDAKPGTYTLVISASDATAKTYTGYVTITIKPAERY